MRTQFDGPVPIHNESDATSQQLFVRLLELKKSLDRYEATKHTSGFLEDIYTSISAATIFIISHSEELEATSLKKPAVDLFESLIFYCKVSLPIANLSARKGMAASAEQKDRYHMAQDEVFAKVEALFAKTQSEMPQLYDRLHVQEKRKRE